MSAIKVRLVLSMLCVGSCKYIEEVSDSEFTLVHDLWLGRPHDKDAYKEHSEQALIQNLMVSVEENLPLAPDGERPNYTLTWKESKIVELYVMSWELLPNKNVRLRYDRRITPDGLFNGAPHDVICSKNNIETVELDYVNMFIDIN